MFDQLKPLIGKLSIFAKQRMKFSHPPKLFLKNDQTNAGMPLGKTAQYDPEQEAITIFVTNRHPKDILRSLAHELVHHMQNLRGDLSPDKMGSMGNNYAQDNQHMRNMEKEAYLQGNMCFRDWEDSLNDEEIKQYKITESIFLKESKTMTTKITKEFLKEMIQNTLRTQLEGKKKFPPADPKTGCCDVDGCGHKAKKKVKENEELEEGGGNVKTDKHDDNPKLKGGQKNLPDALQKGIIGSSSSDSEGDDDKESEEKLTTEDQYVGRKDGVSRDTIVNEMKRIKRIMACLDERLAQTSFSTAEEVDEMLDMAMKTLNSVYKPGDMSGTCTDLLGPLDGYKSGRRRSSRTRDGGNYGMTDPDVPASVRAPGLEEDNSKITTPEQEESLYEQRFTPKNNRLFEKLVKQWTK